MRSRDTGDLGKIRRHPPGRTSPRCGPRQLWLRAGLGGSRQRLLIEAPLKRSGSVRGAVQRVHGVTETTAMGLAEGRAFVRRVILVWIAAQSI